MAAADKLGLGRPSVLVLVLELLLLLVLLLVPVSQSVQFSTPRLIGPGPYYLDAYYALGAAAPSGSIGNGGDAVDVAEDDGAWRVLYANDGSEDHPAPGEMLLPDSPRGWHDLGDAAHAIKDVYANTTRVETRGVRHFDYLGGTFEHVVLNRTVTFEGFPRPIACRAGSKGAFGCPFRLAGGDWVRLPMGTYLLTAIVHWANDTATEATSIVAFLSNDTYAWQYASDVADAADYAAESEEGPNEHALALLADGATVLMVVRMDAGDGPRTHPYRDYTRTVTRDGGRTWSRLQPMTGMGCARPRLLNLADVSKPGAQGGGRAGAVPHVAEPMPGPLVLSGGRMRNRNTSDVLLWVNDDGTASTWTAYSLSYQHNLRETNATLRFDAHVNSTSEPRETTSYTSLLRTDRDGVVVTYGKCNVQGEPNFGFSMAIDLRAA